MNTMNILEQLAKEVHYSSSKAAVIESHSIIETAMSRNDTALIQAQNGAHYLAHAMQRLK